MTKTWQTKLIHSDAKIPAGYKSLATPTYRGSTTVFPSAGAVKDTWDQHKVGYTYGLYGTPTALELAARICELESGSEDGVLAGFEFADACGEFESGRRAVEAVGVADFVLIPGVFDGAGGGENSRGAAIRGRGE